MYRPPTLSAPTPARRRLLLATAASLLGGCAARAASPARAALPLLTRIGEVFVAHRLQFAGTTVGGLSAIDYDPATGLYDLLSDDRSDLQPARVYRARIPLSDIGLGPPELLETVTLRQADGRPWPARRDALPGVGVPDPEAMRRLPGGNFLWTTEGDLPRGFGTALREARADGTLLREFPLPPNFAPGAGRGVRNNLGLEGLALTPDGRSAWAAMEGPLAQDGPPPTVDSSGGACRFTLFDLASGRPVRQLAYVPDAIPMPPLMPGGFADNGVSEVLMEDARHLLVLERAYSLGRGNSLRLYRVDTRDGTDTLMTDTLLPGNHRAAAKALVADFSDLGLSRLDNTEGMTWGPVLPDGRRTLVVVSDDNFNFTQVTQIAAFAYSG